MRGLASRIHVVRAAGADVDGRDKPAMTQDHST